MGSSVPRLSPGLPLYVDTIHELKVMSSACPNVLKCADFDIKLRNFYRNNAPDPTLRLRHISPNPDPQPPP